MAVPAAAAGMVDCLVRRQPEQPWQKTSRWLPYGYFVVRFHQRVLRYIQRIFAISRHPIRHCVDPALMPPHEFLERGPVAVFYGYGEFFVAGNRIIPVFFIIHLQNESRTGKVYTGFVYFKSPCSHSSR